MNNTARIAFVLLVSQISIGAIAQGFNVDFNSNGLPSNAFGAAAGQPGAWNYGSYDHPLIGLNGTRTNVRMGIVGSAGGSGSNYNPANTGDFDKLLNDGAHIGSLYQGGSMYISIRGLEPGRYRVFTYAVQPAGSLTYAPVYVPQAADDHVQVVTGPMPGNSFEHLITHSVHEVVVSHRGPLEIVFDRAPQSPYIVVNGFQIVPVIEAYGPPGLSQREQVSVAALLAPRP